MLKSHFGDLPQEGLYFKSTSNWLPPKVHHTVSTFAEDLTRKVENCLDAESTTIGNGKNLSKAEQEALENLMKKEEIVITKADKGGAVVVQDVTDYVKEANRQLADTNFYKKLKENPTSVNAALVENALDDLKHKNLLEGKLAEKLKPVNPRTPQMYLLPKIHKANNPGRPVVSSVSCHTEKISKFVDHHLQSMNKELESHVQDTTDLVKKLESLPECPKEETILVTLDVRSLYTNIPNNEGLDAIKSYFRSRAAPGDQILSKVICTFLTLILTLNNFVFNGVNYVQTNGASMGTKCAPTYASLFMGKFEERYILPMIRDRVRLYLRYIDDLLMIWTDSEEELIKFLEELNKKHPTIKFEYEYSREKINFLDTTIINSGTRLSTTLYTKPTDRKAYLHCKSYHPTSTKKAIAYSQATRLRRICTEENDFRIHAKKLQTDLERRGYNPEEINKEIERAANVERSSLLTYKEKTNQRRTPLILTYNRKLPNLRGILEETWSHLHINPTERQKFAEKPIICYRRNRNLRDLIGQTRIEKNRVVRKKPMIQGRYTPCRSRANTKCCNQVINTNYFTNKTGRKRFEIRHKVSCKSRNCLYLAWCSKCNDGQYVGKVESQGASLRINKHRNDAKREDSIGIDRHFLVPGHDFDRDFRLIVIEEISNKNLTKEQTRLALLRREDFWIKKLETLEPNGYNDRLNFPNE